MNNSNVSRRQLLSGVAGLGAAGVAGTAVNGQTQIKPGDSLVWQPGHSPDTSKTHFAVNVEMWWGGMPFLDRLKAAADLGYKSFEFWPWRNKDLDGIAKACEELKLTPAQFTGWGFSPGMNNPANHAAFVKEVEAGCQAAHKIGAKKMTIVAGNNQDGMSQEQMLAGVEAGLKLAAPIAEEHDVMLILEPMNGRVDHPGHCLYGSVDAVRICRAVNSTHVKINWDLYHMQISEGDLCGRLREGFDQVGYLQLADHPGRREPGTGEINYGRVFQEAYDLGYRDAFGLECRPLEGEAKATARIAKAARWNL